MSYQTVMVDLVPGGNNAAVLQVALDLATCFKAGVIGVAACEPIQLLGLEGSYIPDDLVAEDRSRIEEDLVAVEVEFRAALEPHVSFVEWRSVVIEAPLATFFEAEARSADILVVGLLLGDAAGVSRAPKLADIVMQAGRPVFVVPGQARGLQLNKVVIGWTDTSEARRAIADALPILRQAKSVTIIEIVEGTVKNGAAKRVEDVTKWLLHHGIQSQHEVVAEDSSGTAQLRREAEKREADILVSGAYGHSRVREWALGGVTHDLLHHSTRCLLLSH